MKNLLAILLLILSPLTFAKGGSAGNGGVAHVCRDQKGEITSAELLDIWKGRKTYPGIEYTKQIETGFWYGDGEFLHYDGLTAHRLAKFKNIFSHYTKYYAGMRGYRIHHQDRCEQAKFNDEFIKSCPVGIEKEEYRFLMVDLELLWSADSDPGIADENCDFEQLGYYNDEGVLLINRKLFHAMDNLNKSAFFTHEFLYRTGRVYENTQNSIEIQKIVAQIYNLIPDYTIMGKLIAKSFPSLKESVGPAMFHKTTTKLELTNSYLTPYSYDLGVDKNFPVYYEVYVKNNDRQQGFQLKIGKFERDNKYVKLYLREKFALPILKVKSGKLDQVYKGVLPIGTEGLEGLYLSLENSNAQIEIKLLQNNKIIGTWNNLKVSKVTKGQNHVLRFVTISELDTEI